MPVTLTVHKAFLIFRWYLLCFSLSPLPLDFSLCTTNKEPGFTFFMLSLQIFIEIDENPLELSLSLIEQPQLSQAFFIGEMLLSSSFFVVLCWTLSSMSIFDVWRGSELDSLQVRLSTEQRGKITSFDLLPIICQMQYRI